jgi:hypothetical protein
MKSVPKVASFFVLVLLAGTGLFAQDRSAAVWQWSVPINAVSSKETNDHPTAFLWIPPNCRQVRGVVIGQHNMLEEGILEHQAFRKNLTKLGFAAIWITPALDMVFDFKAKSTIAGFNEMMKSLAGVSGYGELEFAPVIPVGHSAAASFPWNFAAWDPSRTLAILSIHGDAPLTNMTGSGKPNPDWENKHIDGIPGLFVMGEYEWLEGRIAPAISYRKAHPGSAIAYLCDAGFGHFDYSDELVGFINLFIAKSAKARLPASFVTNRPVALKPIDPLKGWLVDRWRNNKPAEALAAPFAAYRGNKEEAGWAFDKEMAMATERYYLVASGKLPQYIGYVQQGKVLAASGFSGFNPKFLPLPDGLTFNLSARYLDSLPGKPKVKGHAAAKIGITRICGPVIKINDTTFKIAFYRMGFNNPKRSGDIWFMARSDGDAVYKSAVQQANMKIPVFNKEGKKQQIDFPDVSLSPGQRSVRLKAVSDSGEPVAYYIKEGPAVLKDNVLYITKIPPGTRYPVKVTVVAWQYGRNFEPKLQSALPVEQIFYLSKP